MTTLQGHYNRGGVHCEYSSYAPMSSATTTSWSLREDSEAHFGREVLVNHWVVVAQRES